MAFDMNSVELYGNITFVDDLKEFGETKILTFGVATSKKFQEKEYTTFHNVRLFNKAAEYYNGWLQKGDRAYVKGTTEVKVWEKDGVKKKDVYVKPLLVIKEDKKPSTKPAPVPTPATADVSMDEIPF